MANSYRNLTNMSKTSRFSLLLPSSPHRPVLCIALIIAPVSSPAGVAMDLELTEGKGAHVSEKFLRYRTHIEALREYVLVSQHRPLVEHYVRQPGGSWSYSSANDPSESIYLPSIDCRLPLSEIYDRIIFPAGVADTGEGQGRH